MLACFRSQKLVMVLGFLVDLLGIGSSNRLPHTSNLKYLGM